ncbi:MAG TPA: GNAT family N-acetyltransferase [Terriglobales bacterium]|nr:GNAT family N-acetyltransferase [Terriglobales bacterium]
MNNQINIVTLTADNYQKFGCPCFLNPKHEGHLKKLEWLKKRFAEGLKIKLLFAENEKKPIGFVEYVPGEYAWRAVDARGYLFIHCIWISLNKYKEKGYASLLIEECLKDAKKQGMYGIAAITSEGPFMAGRDLFLKNGFCSVAKTKPSFELMIKPLKKGPLPKFTDWEKQLSRYKGLNIVYANQCPWIARSIKNLCEIAERKDLKIKITELKSAKEAQNSPSVYGTFSLIYNGKLLADHYISSTRFLNIIKKEKFRVR